MGYNLKQYEAALPFLRGGDDNVSDENDKKRLMVYDLYESIYINSMQTLKLVLRGVDSVPILMPSGRKIIEATHRFLATDFDYFVDEGGYGALGAKGAATILTDHDTQQYDYIIAAVGTGTMLAGCINAAQPNQKVIGIPVLRNEGTIHTEINALLTDKNKAYTLLHQFHQGGYAKTNPKMIEFMNGFWEKEKIPTDIVYTSKLLFAVDNLIKENYFEKDRAILIIHSGGLQGNRSLPTGTLLF